jgi:hypothetical protein
MDVLKVVPSRIAVANLEFECIDLKSALSGAKCGIRGNPLGSRTSSQLDQSFSSHLSSCILGMNGNSHLSISVRNKSVVGLVKVDSKLALENSSSI